MASSPTLPQSPARSAVDLRHPVPDLQSLQGAYVGNIERLEEHAERMSEAGSDLQEEIRKTYSELKLSDSRRSSLHSIQTDDLPIRHITRSRGVSLSSHANSIVEVNGNARWGGYSPGGYITSPVGSLRSGTSIHRQRSGSKASRLGQIIHAEEAEEEESRKYDPLPESPKSHRSAPQNSHERDSPEPNQRKVSSFTRIFDEVANTLPEDLRESAIMGTPPKFTEHHEPEEAPYDYVDPRDIPDRPPTAASTDTTHQARTLWMDFDGVHCPDTVEEEPEPSNASQTHSRQHSSNHSFMMRSNQDLPSMMAPPPDDGMVFYPAPVPRMLNLPKRLSQLPASNVQAKRRTLLLESMQAEHRKSMPLPGEDMGDSPKGKSRNRQSLMALPPQLRASAYFDNRVAPAQEFAVKGESAEDTLDSILNASAHAPVSAFTDHPFAGHVGKEVYGPEHKKRMSKAPEVPPTLQETKRRSSFNILDTKHNSSGGALKKLRKRNSSADMNLLLVKANETRVSLGDQLEHPDDEARGPHAEQGFTPTRPSFEAGDERNPDDIHEEEALAEGEEDDEEEELQYGAPTTLLAELQFRKAKQKTRNLNYVTLMEQGLISGRQTLLQMNDLAEAEKQRRIRKKVTLAWEAPEDDSDDDVPLGVLYKQPERPGPNRLKSMGLLEQRELEDSEPLSRRRNRLLGISPDHRQTHHLGASSSQVNLAVPNISTPEPESDEEEGETLADRMRRIKEKQQRDEALGDVRKSTVSGDFAAEMMSKLGVAEEENKTQDAPEPAPPAAPDADPEEETLGQRRARLQAEAALDGDSISAHRPPIGFRSTSSLADILSANPLHDQARKISNEMLVSHLPQGSLLHKNELDEQKKKQQRLNATMRASSYGAMDPLVKGVGSSLPKDDDDIPLGQKIQAYKNMQNPMMRNSSMPGMGMMPPSMQNSHLMGGATQPQQQQQQSMMNANMGLGVNMMQNPMPNPNPTANPNMLAQNSFMGMQQLPMQMNGMPMQMPMQMNGMPMQMPMGMNGMPMNMPMNMQMPINMGMNGMPMPMNMNMPMGMGMMPNGAGMMMGPPMDPRQRDQIDRWMQGIRN